MRKVLLCAGTALSCLIGQPVATSAADLTVGMRTEMVPDPHSMWSYQNTQFYRHYFGYLFKTDQQSRFYPELVESYEGTAERWIFRLRKGLAFDDGTPFTAADAVASLHRARTLPNAVGSYAGLFAGVSEIKALDDHTVELLTSRPYPTLPHAMSEIPIIPEKIAKTATQQDFVAGKANVGLGPYRFVKYLPGDRLVLKRNDAYFGKKPEWENLTLRMITDSAARVAALLGGDVDMVDGVPPQDVKRIKADARFAVHVSPSVRLVYVMFDTERDVSPFVKGPNGEALTKNPLKDLRVRQAMTMAVDRNAIRDRVMDGLSFPSSQMVARGSGGYNPDIPVPPYDPERSKALLKEAGWPNGFTITLHCTNDRYVNDARICQVLGQMFARIGVKTDVQTMPSAAFFPKMTDHPGDRASALLLSWSHASSGEADVLYNQIHTYDKEKRLGTWNLLHYSNPKVDALIEKSMVTLDTPARQKIQAEAMAIAMGDVAVLTLHDQSVVVATRKGLSYVPYSSEFTIAYDVVTAKGN